ncbi:DAK2 domain-containing protein [Mollicutes bacterium LVI A0039]|nr:DAK2 domain-containing protein [Mollicutes bacterium LVI A0039]
MNKLNAKKYQEMIQFSGQLMEAHKEEINSLNVFPVPDGDTGSNMNMTIQSGVKAITGANTVSLDEIAKAFSKGLLMGARGNSGVILSQFFRGLSEGLADKDVATSKEFHAAIGKGVERAYASVIKAVEGTILTVAREMHENVTAPKADIIEYFEQLIVAGEESLNNTPELLPVLKEVGVVDSGGKGLLVIFEGMLANLKGEELDLSGISSFEDFQAGEEHPINPEDITFGYCTEMLLRLHEPSALNITEVQKYLTSKGDSIVAIQDEEILKIHVHTEVPLEVFAYGSKIGDFVHVKSENMRIQAEEAHGNSTKPRKEQAVVTVASSEGMADLFKDIQDVEIVSGGQTMNPSTEDLVNAVLSANADKVIILPNNSNIIMSAKAAIDLIDDVEVEVVESKYMTQAIEALIAYSADADFDANIGAMKEAITEVTSIEVTTAIKTTSIEGIEITENDFIGIVNGKIKLSMAEEKVILKTIFEKLIEADMDVITILLGEGSNVNLIDELIEFIEEESPFTEVQKYVTNQPVYPYLISGV